MIIEAREDTITLTGLVSGNIWPAIQAAAAMLLKEHPTGIIIDCSEIEGITQEGGETFAHAFGYIADHNARIVVSGLKPEQLETVREVPGVRSQLPLAASVEEARASFRLEELELHRGRARIAAVVPMLGNWQRAVFHADRLALGENSEVHLLDLIKVPRTLPLGTPLKDREEAGQERLRAAEALVKKTKLKSFVHVRRVRSNSGGLGEFTTALKADFAVVSLDCGERETPIVEDETAMAQFPASGCEVSLIKGSPEDTQASPQRVMVPAVGNWEHALEHSCRLVRRDQALVELISIIPIPRAQALDIPMPDADAEAEYNGKEAARIARKYGVKLETRTERVRDAIVGFGGIVKADRPDLVVVGVGKQTEAAFPVAQGMAESLLSSVPCEVVLLRVSV